MLSLKIRYKIGYLHFPLLFNPVLSFLIKEEKETKSINTGYEVELYLSADDMNVYIGYYNEPKIIITTNK